MEENIEDGTEYSIGDNLRANIEDGGKIKEDVITLSDNPNKDFLTYAKEALGISKVDIRTYSPLALAYIGDAVYELIVRSQIMHLGNMQVKKMHIKSAKLVKASAQAKMIELILQLLTEEEDAIYKRGRNAKSVTMAKNATMIDYKMATGFEALVGYLYLTEQLERLIELVSFGLKKMQE